MKILNWESIGSFPEQKASHEREPWKISQTLSSAPSVASVGGKNGYSSVSASRRVRTFQFKWSVFDWKTNKVNSTKLVFPPETYFEEDAHAIKKT